jgi:DNA topoisomerase III
MSTAVIAEKPTVARDIASVLGATRRGNGFYYGKGYTVSWALGHLVTLAEPHEINPSWKAWRRDLLPMLPRRWPLKVLDATRAQYQVVEKILTDPQITSVICATDAGREGELIFRYVFESVGCNKPVSRLWISSLTPAAIKRGMANLKSSSAYDNLASAARGRSQADWLVGMNLSRLYTLVHDEKYSVGRVQTPTLAMLVERTQAIQSFVPEDYLEVVATFSIDTGSYVGVFYDEKNKTRLPADGEQARAIEKRATSGAAEVEKIKKETKRRPSPLLYDLTELQRHANRVFGFSAKKTLQIAQRLYEKYKLISYPRTDSRHLSRDVAGTLKDIVDVIRAPFEEKLAPGTGERPLGKRFVDDGRVTDHHAIIPTSVPADMLAPGGDEHKIYDLICRRLLSAWHDDHVSAVTTVMTRIVSSPEERGSDPVVDRYRASGTIVVQKGWQALDLPLKKKKAVDNGERCQEQTFPEGLKEGDAPTVDKAEILKKRTKPPRPFTDATLLTAMETAGKTLEDKALSDAMRENGLGTPATRAAIIETLIQREYITRNGKSLVATDKGIRLIDVVHDHVKSPAMTGQWERRLKEIERGTERLDRFMTDIEVYLQSVMGEASPKGKTPANVSSPGDAQPQSQTASAPFPLADPPRLAEVPPPEFDDYSGSMESAPVVMAPESTHHRSAGGFREVSFAIDSGHRAEFPSTPQKRESRAAHPSPRPERQVSQMGIGTEEALSALLRRAFGFDRFRPHQAAVCQAVTEGQNVLLVMPTGAGKSLCYQLPGIARAGTTLVVSPLIALMEDQTAALRQMGFVAERIHSGMGRDTAREVCRQYLRGDLDFLFIAPERLGVPGFPEMLSKRMPVLVAVDEAHCISHWGHDFRPDYRMLKERLTLLRSAPIIAMTATATPIVQDDIVHQLDMPNAGRFIHGFRRTNIAVEVVEMPQRARGEATLKLLSTPERRPAIVYAPTRKKAEDLAANLAPSFPTAAYHAGMPPAMRERVQADFLKGHLEVIVATIAFGMGIDKPDVRTVVHVALPGSMESYYQEIGRAGRDGLPSRAVLMYTYADVKTHEFFLDRDYPDPGVLAMVYDRLTPRRQSRDSLVATLGLDEDLLSTVLEKLWIHGGADITPDESVSRGRRGWHEPYLEQKRHKQAQLELMVAYAQSKECRMLRMVRHFGDQEDGGDPCGTCDVCRPEKSVTRTTRSASDTEQRLVLEVLKTLQFTPSAAKGKLYREEFEATLSRNEFEALIDAMFRARLIRIEQDAFTKGGRTIEYQRLRITEKGYQWLREKRGDHGDIQITVVTPPKQKKKLRRRSSSSAKSEKEPRPVAVKPRTIDADVKPPNFRVVSELKAWRLELARKRRIPAFRILTDRVVNNIAQELPQTEDDLIAISGIGDTLMKKYGDQILTICRRSGKL